jgi:release factor glutamine methyltransferase
VSTEKQWTVLETLEWTARYLAEKGVPSARLEAQLLLGHVLGLSRVQLYVAYERPLSLAEREQFKAIVRERVRGRPVAHLVGGREFWNHWFHVPPTVFVPRPETETLVEKAVDLLRPKGKRSAEGQAQGPAPTTEWAGTRPAPTAEWAGTRPAPAAEWAGTRPAPAAEGQAQGPAPTTEWAGTRLAPTAEWAGTRPAPAAEGQAQGPAPTGGALRTTSDLLLLDLCTGSGNVVVSLLSEFPNARALAIDISAQAVETAGKNAAAAGVAERLELVCADVRPALAGLSGRFHLITCNPPYVPTAQWERLEPAVRTFEPRVAVDGGPDGLELARAIVGLVGARLVAGGAFLMEYSGAAQTELLRKLFAAAGFERIEVLKDLAGLDRVICGILPAAA